MSRRVGGGDVGEGGGNARVLVAAHRILALATESLNMIRNVTGVMKDSSDLNEAYAFFPLHICFSFYSMIILFQMGRPSTDSY